jgi:hypothetical protein
MTHASESPNLRLSCGAQCGVSSLDIENGNDLPSSISQDDIRSYATVQSVACETIGVEALLDSPPAQCLEDFLPLRL